MKAIPPHPGLPSALQELLEARRRKLEGLERREGRDGIPPTVTPGLAWRAGRHTRPGRRARVGWACNWLAKGLQASLAGPAGQRPGTAGGVSTRGAALGGARAGELVTVWFTPHIRTLRIGSLARNSFTFWHTKCFFLVLVLLALSGATATAVVLVQLEDMPGAAAAAEKGGASETAHKPAVPGLPRTDHHPRSLTAPWSRPSRYLPTPPRWFRPPHAPPFPPRPREPAGPLRTPPPGGAAAPQSPGPFLPACVVSPVWGRQRPPGPLLLPGPDRN